VELHWHWLSSSAGTDTNSVPCALEDHVILQSLWNTSIAPLWQLTLQGLLCKRTFADRLADVMITKCVLQWSCCSMQCFAYACLSWPNVMVLSVCLSSLLVFGGNSSLKWDKLHTPVGKPWTTFRIGFVFRRSRLKSQPGGRQMPSYAVLLLYIIGMYMFADVPGIYVHCVLQLWQVHWTHHMQMCLQFRRLLHLLLTLSSVPM